MPTEEQQEKARQRAEARTAQKAQRAAQSGLKVAFEKDSVAASVAAAAVEGFSSVGGKGKPATIKKMTAKMIFLEAQQNTENTKLKRLERAERRKLIKKQKKLERELEYLNFPTILGWYFDGFFTPYFQLNEEYAQIFNQMELDISKSKENSIKETFAEKAKRYFWPPDDPPHTPPEIVLDQRMEAVTLFVATEKTEMESKVPSDEIITASKTTLTELQLEEERVFKMIKDIEDNPNLTSEEKSLKKRALLFALKKKRDQHKRMGLHDRVAEEMRLKSINRNDFYFDDQIPGFFSKRRRDSDKYYFDSQWNVWRVKRKIIPFPNDYYWDEQLAMFFPKDRTRQPNYYLYDPNIEAYRVAGDATPPNWRGIKPSDYFFDHKDGKWIKKSKAPAGQEPFMDPGSHRLCINKDKDTPDDFYFDIFTEQFEKKMPEGGQYFYDPDFGSWRQKNTPLPIKGQLKPIDYYWNEDEHTFKKKDAPSSFFAWDSNSNFFRKKRSLHGKFHPKNWTWNDKKKEWELKKSMSRHTLISDSLYWRADRDYDKPWLEYIGGYKDYHISYDYDKLSDEDDGKSGRGGDGTSSKGGGGGAGGAKKLQFSVSSPAMKIGAKGKDVSGGKDAGGTGKDDGAGAKDAMSVSGKDDTTSGSMKQPSGIMKESKMSMVPGMPGSPSQSETLTFVDTLDRKTLKVIKLGILTDTDLRKYFASVKKIIRPLQPGTTLEEDYAFLKFKTDEAAAAALKTMHGQSVKGVKLQLSYKLKAEKESEGGNHYVAVEGLKVKGRETQETNSTKEYAHGIANEVGRDEICYPDKPNLCQSSSAVCIWVRRDKQYKCKTRPSKQHSNLKDRGSSRGRIIPDNHHQKNYENIFPAHAITRQKRTADDKNKKSSNPRQSHAKTATVNVIPEFEGLMAWDDDTEQCIEKFDMAEKLQSSEPEADKKTWVEANKHRICDFKKFFHCYLEDFLDQVDILDDPTKPDIDPNDQPRAVCQCYESSMTIVKDKCYIPARLGTKSTCGDKIYGPYPVQPWANAPLLKPQCTPNSECRESQYYFGKRCECHYTAKFNYETHTCDSATKITFSVLNIVLLLMHFIFCL
ncbi:Multiple RNA-binding domain-containing protein 1 [Orchesella cincta]|uniref:Multiple RNA-binding domain-containing protein 1 n=1 Tax=Orchesella cincta TaxID=48709 RepID=A0A1D2NJK3_ORCCI|nr:Multiple RNA-binding domain-containing protein 1 [Orchesella cincta]